MWTNDFFGDGMRANIGKGANAYFHLAKILALSNWNGGDDPIDYFFCLEAPAVILKFYCGCDAGHAHGHRFLKILRMCVQGH